MTCFGPIDAYRPKRFLANGDPNPDRRLVFRKDKGETGIRIRIPCGQCAGCRLETSRQWAMRCMHEKQMHNASSFLTLTYSDARLPEGGSLSMDDYQKFMKRLRWKFGDGIRFCGCGEYGDTTRRAHYHILLLNIDFNDRVYHKMSPSGAPLFTSKVLDDLWSDDLGNLGHALIGNVDFDSCAYVARYVMKKIDNWDTVKSGLYCPVTGLVREAPFLTMSRRPGLGSSWFDKYGIHAYKFDSIIMNGMEVRPPRFYDGKYEKINPEGLVRLKIARRRKAAIYKSDNTVRRLRVRECVMLAKLKLKGRSL